MNRCPLRSRCEEGICQPLNCACENEIEQPVCSTQGQTFPNICELECVGASLQSRGACPDHKCNQEIPCPENKVCLVNFKRNRIRDCIFENQCDLKCFPKRTRMCARDTECPSEQTCAIPPARSGAESPPPLGICVHSCSANTLENSFDHPDCPAYAPFCSHLLNECKSVCDLELNQCPDGLVCRTIETDLITLPVGVCIPPRL